MILTTDIKEYGHFLYICKVFASSSEDWNKGQLTPNGAHPTCAGCWKGHIGERPTLKISAESGFSHTQTP